MAWMTGFQVLGKKSLVRDFLAIERWRAFSDALRRETSSAVVPPLPSIAVFLAFIVTITPVALTFAAERSRASESVFPTLAFGVCTLLAIVSRRSLGLRLRPTENLRNALSLTHTAVALGCIPAVLAVVFSPKLLSQRHNLLSQQMQVGPHPGAHPASLIFVILLVMAIALWVAVTEEIIFRGLLVSIIRRWHILPTQRSRDILAVLCSAVIFGAAHYSTWGPAAALGLAGLGLGFSLAYIANGEQIVPVVLYHFAFDFLSIMLSLLL